MTDPPFHRYSVGMRNGYDLMGGLQFTLLFALGLREQHRVCDVGCGSLRVGRFLIPYLEAGNYYGIEPRQEVVEAGIDQEVGRDLLAARHPHFDYGTDFGLARFDTSFDFVIAQSVFSHTYRDLATVGLDAIRATLAPEGLFVGTVYEEYPVLLPRGHNARPDEGSGFVHQGAVRVHVARLEGDARARRPRRIPHALVPQPPNLVRRRRRGPRRRTETHHQPRDPRLRGPGFAGHVKRRVLAKIKPG